MPTNRLSWQILLWCVKNFVSCQRNAQIGETAGTKTETFRQPFDTSLMRNNGLLRVFPNFGFHLEEIT